MRGRYVWNATALAQLDLANTDFLLGLFQDSHMNYEYVRSSEPDPHLKEAGEPSLAEMTRAAIDILGKSQDGYFLFVEGGRIDHAHHSNRAKLALVETVAFDLAVRTAAEMTSQEDTLIVVTADHSHVLVISGYPSRGNSITGPGTVDEAIPTSGTIVVLTGVNDLCDAAYVSHHGEEDVNLAEDELPYTTLLYGNGPGYSHTNGSREDIALIDVEDVKYRQQSAVPLHSETHAGEDVAIYARGPMGHLFHATHEQSYIAYAMAYASCVGAYANLSECAAALETTTATSRNLSTSGRSREPGEAERREQHHSSSVSPSGCGDNTGGRPLTQQPVRDVISGEELEWPMRGKNKNRKGVICAVNKGDAADVRVWGMGLIGWVGLVLWL